jgi:hypothetical protein
VNEHEHHCSVDSSGLCRECEAFRRGEGDGRAAVAAVVEHLLDTTQSDWQKRVIGIILTSALECEFDDDLHEMKEAESCFWRWQP